MAYRVSVKKPNGETRSFETSTLPEQKTGAFQETLELNKHYYFILSDGTEVEYRQPDAVKASILTPSAPAQTPTPGPAAPRFFSADSFYNKKLTNEPIHANSANLVAELSQNCRIYAPWIATKDYSVPVFYADGSSAIAPVIVTAGNANEAELKAGIRIPAGVRAANGGDGHLAIWDKVSDTCYSFWQFKLEGAQWKASSCGVIKNASKSDGIEPRQSGWNSATACHLPLVGGLIMIDELKAGVIPHALAFAIGRPANRAVWPASTSDGFNTDPNAIPEGARFRFPADLAIDPNWTPLTKMLVTAVRDYGMVLRDTANGVPFYVEDDGTGEASITPYMNGKAIWDVVGARQGDGEFPWSKLQAIA